MRSVLLLGVVVAGCHHETVDDAPDVDAAIPNLAPCAWNGGGGSFVGPSAQPRQLLVNPDGSLVVVGGAGGAAFAMVFDPTGAPGPMQTSTDAVEFAAVTARPSGGYDVAGTTSDGRPIVEALDATGAVDPTGCKRLGSSGLRGLAARETSAGLLLVSVGPSSAATNTAEVELDRFTASCAPDTTFGPGGFVRSTIPAADASQVVPARAPIGFVLPNLDTVVASLLAVQSGATFRVTTFPAATPTTPTKIDRSAGNVFYLDGPVGSIGLDGAVTFALSAVEQLAAETAPAFETVVVRTDGSVGPGTGGRTSLIADAPAIRWRIGATNDVDAQLVASPRDDAHTILAQAPVSPTQFTTAMARADGALFTIGQTSGLMVVRCFAAP